MSNSEIDSPQTEGPAGHRPIPAGVSRGTGELECNRGAIHGFGRLWRKEHSVRFCSIEATPTEVVRVWRENFGDYWPAGNRFFGPRRRLQSGEVAVLDLDMPGGTRLSTGIYVLYADDETFTLMTPRGHMFAGWITFSAFASDEATVARAEIVMRATDPAFEVGLELFGHSREARFWEETLRNLVHHFGGNEEPETTVVLLDCRRQWTYARNLWHNSAIRSVLHLGLAPIRRMSRRASGGQPTSSGLQR